MEIVIPLVLVGALITAGVVWRRRADRQAAEAPRDDTLRAGVEDETTPQSAARRAEGKAAWMRPTGF